MMYKPNAGSGIGDVTNLLLGRKHLVFRLLQERRIKRVELFAPVITAIPEGSDDGFKFANH